MFFRIIEEHLGSVGVEALGGQGMIHADLLFQHLDRWANPLKRHPSSSEARQHEGLGEANEWHRRLTTLRRKAGDQRMLGIQWPSPALDIRLRHVKVASRLAQREDGAGNPRIICS